MRKPRLRLLLPFCLVLNLLPNGGVQAEDRLQVEGDALENGLQLHQTCLPEGLSDNSESGKPYASSGLPDRAYGSVRQSAMDSEHQLPQDLLQDAGLDHEEISQRLRFLDWSTADVEQLNRHSAGMPPLHAGFRDQRYRRRGECP